MSDIFPLFAARMPLILASSSPRRRELIASLGVAFLAQSAPDHVEPAPEAGESPERHTLRAAIAKTRHVRDHSGIAGAAVLGADTAVALEGTMMGKPRDGAEALAYLLRLAGHTHTVVTSCCLCLPDGAEEVFSVAAQVTMRAWPEPVLAAYAGCCEPLDKAGGYAIQGKGSFLIEAIQGSWSAVVGLPMTETVAMLLRCGVIMSWAAKGEKGHALAG